MQVAKLTVKEVGADDLSGLAAELAYRFFLAVFPFFIFLGALGGLIATSFGISNPTDRIMNSLGDTLPQDASSVLRGQLHAIIDSRNTGLLSVGIIGAIWAASSGMNTLIKALNRAHDVTETRPMLKKYGVAVGLTVLAGSAVVVAFIVLVAGQVYGQQIADKAGLQGSFGLFVRYVRWPVVAGLLLVATAFLYWAAPNIKRPLRWLTPGAALFVASWLVATYLFGLYVSHFNSYNKTYGTLGGVVALLVWFYITAFILLLGEELNSVIDQQLGPEAHEKERRGQAVASASADAAARQRVRGGARAPAARESARRIGPAAAALGLAVAALEGLHLVRSLPGGAGKRNEGADNVPRGKADAVGLQPGVDGRRDAPPRPARIDSHVGEGARHE